MFETGTAASVRAYHVMPDAPPPENERHAHDYRIEVVVGRRTLDERGMVVDLDVLDETLAALAAGLEGEDLDKIKPDDAEAVTVEIFAKWLHDELHGSVGAGLDRLAVRVWESETAFGGYDSSS